MPNYDKSTVEILKDWLIEHSENPYPSR